MPALATPESKPGLHCGAMVSNRIRRAVASCLLHGTPANVNYLRQSDVLPTSCGLGALMAELKLTVSVKS